MNKENSVLSVAQCKVEEMVGKLQRKVKRNVILSLGSQPLTFVATSVTHIRSSSMTSFNFKYIYLKTFYYYQV